MLGEDKEHKAPPVGTHHTLLGIPGIAASGGALSIMDSPEVVKMKKRRLAVIREICRVPHCRPKHDIGRLLDEKVYLDAEIQRRINGESPGVNNLVLQIAKPCQGAKF